MKKSTVAVIVIAVIMSITGAALFVGGMVASGGSESAVEVLEKLEIYLNEEGLDLDISAGNHQKHETKEMPVEKQPEETAVVSEKVQFSDMEPVTFSMEEVESLYLEVNDADVEFGGSTSGEIIIRTDGGYEYYVKNKVLYVKPKGIQKEHEMLIELPVLQEAGKYLFKEAEIHAGASEIFISEISAREFDLEIGAGRVTINQLTAEQADFEIGAGEVIVEYGNVYDCETNVDAGNFEYTGMILKHGDVECNLGNAEYHLEREPEDYNYEIECGAGNVTIGKESFTGLGTEKYIDNHVQESFDIECNMGNVTIDSMN